jgi:hypothetical protein
MSDFRHGLRPGSGLGRFYQKSAGGISGSGRYGFSR